MDEFDNNLILPGQICEQLSLSGVDSGNHKFACNASSERLQEIEMWAQSGICATCPAAKQDPEGISRRLLEGLAGYFDDPEYMPTPENIARVINGKWDRIKLLLQAVCSEEEFQVMEKGYAWLNTPDNEFTDEKLAERKETTDVMQVISQKFADLRINLGRTNIQQELADKGLDINDIDRQENIMMYIGAVLHVVMGQRNTEIIVDRRISKPLESWDILARMLKEIDTQNPPAVEDLNLTVIKFIRKNHPDIF